MSGWYPWLPIAVIFCLFALQADGKQNPVEVPALKKTLSADGVEIAYTIQGKGETGLIFIHGGFADRTFWQNQMKPFAKKYRVVALDLAGHGESGKNRKKWDVYSFAEDVRAVTEKEKLGRVVLVGNSLGGPVALEAARLLPKKVAAIVAVDTFQDIDRRAPVDYFKEQARAFRADFTGTMRKMVRSLFHDDVDAALYAHVEDKMLKHSPEMAGALLESFADYDLAEAARNVVHPIYCINGDLYPTQVEKNRRLHPDFFAVILPHTGHYPMLERPALFNRHLEDILQKLEKSK